MNKKKVILITGGATSLAREIALSLSLENKIIIHYNNSEEEAKSLLKDIGEEHCKIIKADFLNEDSAQFFKKAISLFSAIDVILNMSSIFTKININEINKFEIEKYTNIHSTFPLLLTLEYYKYLKENKKTGVVLNFTDAQLENPTLGRIPYYLSKSSLSFQTKLLAAEVAPNLRINEIAPGFTLAKEWEEKYFDKINEKIPFGIVKVKEIINTINYLIDSEQITGQSIKVDGGLSTLPFKLI